MRTIRQSTSKIFLLLFQASKNNNLTHLSREITFQRSSIRPFALQMFFHNQCEKNQKSLKPIVSLKFHLTCYRAEPFVKGKAEVSWVKSTLICCKDTYCHLQWTTQLSYLKLRRSNKIRDMGKESHTLSLWFSFFTSLCIDEGVRSL